MDREALKIDPFVIEASERLAQPAQPPSDDPQIMRERAAADDAARTEALGIVPVPVATEEHTVTVPGHPDARLRVYWPTETRAPEGAGLPVLVYFFGGAFAIGGIDWVSWDATFRAYAADAGIIVVAGQYSFAPEVRFPAQPEQCWSVFEWAVEHAASLGGDAERMAIGGASSGGNLAAAVTLMNRDRAHRTIRLQLLENPSLDLTGDHLDVFLGVPGMMSREEGEAIVRGYLGDDPELTRHPYASPLLADAHAELPPAVIYTAELDPLRGDGEAYVRVLTSAGVPAVGIRYLEQTHTSSGLRGAVEAADHRHRDVVQTLRTLHES
ncbi:MAG: alpha/beta hydrolase [Microbacterium sp.]